jgi:hypothetical protein
VRMRRRRAKAGRYVPPPLPPLPSVERILEEGVLISASAVRMTIKNHIIVAALRDHTDYDRAGLLDVARADLLRLAGESEATAERLDAKRPETREPGESAADAHRRREHLRRPKVERMLATALRSAAVDEEAIERLVDRAQTDASEEIRREVIDRLLSTAITPDPDYEANKAGRIAYLISVDLAELRKPYEAD